MSLPIQTLPNKIHNRSGQSTLVFTATFNESENIERLCKDVLMLGEDIDILVVDDNSPDGTGDILRSLEKANSRIKSIHRRCKLGVGSAHLLAMKYALENNYNRLITLDADFSHPVRCIPYIIRSLEENDYIIGSRYIEGGSTEYSGIRLLISLGANICARAVLGIKITETTSSYRGFNKKALRTITNKDIESNGYSFFIEVSYWMSRMKLRVHEFPFDFIDRQMGKSKISKREIAKAVFCLWRLFLNRAFGYNQDDDLSKIEVFK